MKALEREVVLKALVGSHNYNIANIESDRDYKVFIAPTFEELYKGERFSKSIITPTEDNDIHDVRKLADLLFKANINFLEVLASNEIIVPNGNPEILEILDMKDEIFKMNLPYLYDACMGMHYNKMKQLTKGTEGTQHLVDKYGYDTKQATHAFRVINFIEKYESTNFTDFTGSLKYDGFEREFILGIRHGQMTLQEYENFIKSYYEFKFVPLKERYKSHDVDLKVKEKIEDLIMQLIKRKIKEG